MMSRVNLIAVSALTFLVSGAALAQEAAKSAGPSAQVTREQEGEQAFVAAVKAATPGPAEIPLLEQGKLAVPKGYLFVPKSEAGRLMRAFGNQTGPTFVGLVMPDDQAEWFATLNFQNVGYVKDDDAKTWNADELLQALKDGTESGNSDRAQRGFPPIEVSGWVEPPRYTSETHRLVWAANVRRKGESAGGSVNFNTYALGRDGYFELNMVGAADVIVKERGRVQELLAALSYVPGKAYGDFNPSTDKVAEYGLAALIAGVAAKKLGMFALIGVFLLKAWKVVALAAFGLIALMSKLFGKKTVPPAA
jgi:uncharacterized membrane-anchored protein